MTNQKPIPVNVEFGADDLEMVDRVREYHRKPNGKPETRAGYVRKVVLRAAKREWARRNKGNDK